MRISDAKHMALLELRGALRAQLHAAAQGTAHTAHERTRADRVMCQLLSAGVVTQRELLSIVAEERARVGGPATRLVPLDEIPRGSA